MTGIAERVAAGAAFLDACDPDWWRPGVERAIDLDTLDLGDGSRCILGQRCPVETLVAYLGYTPEDDDDLELSYHAYGGNLTGLPAGYCGREVLEEWAEAHGFNQLPANREIYVALTAEWKRVITERRSAS